MAKEKFENSASRDEPPPSLGLNLFNFMQFLGKVGKNNRLAPPPLQLAHPPLGNPGSATAVFRFLLLSRHLQFEKL